MNVEPIIHDIEWLRKVLDLRLRAHAGEDVGGDPLARIPAPKLSAEDSCYATVVRQMGLGVPERLLLVLCLAPHVQPEALDTFFLRNQSIERRFTEFGGVSGVAHSGFLPTGYTALFLLAGDDLRARLGYGRLLSADHALFSKGVLQWGPGHGDEPVFASLLMLTPEYRERLITGRSYEPPFSAEFPAQRISTGYEWEDLVLERSTREDVLDLVNWVRHEGILMEDWMLKKRLKAGFRTLFFGPPGTGKTMTACLLGKATGLPVFRVDLSKVVSKYIGETEKNLANLFDHAERQRWILFFDEADSLFGKRTDTRNANDRAANQQVSYLLQRIEDFPGVAILASNLRSNLDEAFARRFQSMIHFPMPNAEQRLRLWEDNFRGKPYPLAKDVDLGRLAREHEFSGGSIINVLRYACVKAVVRNPPEIVLADILSAISKERQKEGRSGGSGG